MHAVIYSIIQLHYDLGLRASEDNLRCPKRIPGGMHSHADVRIHAGTPTITCIH